MPHQKVLALLKEIDTLSDADLLRLHREVCRRAAAIYEPMYREKRLANHATGVAAWRGQRG